MHKTLVCPHCKGTGKDPTIGYRYNLSVDRPRVCPNCRGFRTYTAEVTNKDLLNNLSEVRKSSVVTQVACKSVIDTLLRVSGVVLSDDQKKIIQDEMNKSIDKFMSSKADISDPIWSNLEGSDLKGFSFTVEDILKMKGTHQ